jgi:UMF1 family MFS transporter
MTNKREVNREHWAWYLFDFGNSAYAAVVLLAIYSEYFKSSVVGGSEGSRLWGISIFWAMLIVAVIAPILGTLADHSGKKKTMLMVFTSIAIAFTASLFFVGPGDKFIGMLFFIIAEIGYRGGQVFYNSLLPEIATQDEIGKVSGNGWAIGSIGGILCLVIVLAMILLGGDHLVKYSFLITAVFYAIFSVPLFRIIKEKSETQALPRGDNYLSLAFRRLKKTFAKVRNYKEFLKFMLAYLIYNDGILAAMDFAAILGAVLYGMEQTELIVFMIIVQATSVVGAWLYGRFGEKHGFKRGLIQSLLWMILAVIWIFFNKTLTGFFLIGALAGFALTGVQSLSRTMIGAFAPPGQSAEFFGFFGMVGRTSSFIGPLLFGWLADKLTKYYEAQQMVGIEAEKLGHRMSLFSIFAFLVVGMIILLQVNEKEGRKIAQGQVVIGGES